MREETNRDRILFNLLVVVVILAVVWIIKHIF